jgi:targeting protein for Xklp2
MSCLKSPWSPVADLGEVELYTERRAEKRAEFDAVRAEHEQEAAAMRAAAEALRAEEERREYERQRAAAVHRAAPIKKFRRVDVKPSDRPLTQPVTPRFSTRLRTRPADTSNDENL